MAATATSLRVKGLGQQAMTELVSKAKRLGATPERYVKELVQEDLALDRKARTTTLAELMGPGREIDEDELDKLVEAARKRHHRAHGSQKVGLVPAAYRVVLDTKYTLEGVLEHSVERGRVVDACDRRTVILLLSKPVLSEYRAVLTAQQIVERYPELTKEKVEIALWRLRYVGDTLRSVRADFEYVRDPKDEKFVELAIAGEASHIVTADKDLLSLAFGYGEAAKRFRQRASSVRVLEAKVFVAIVGISAGVDRPEKSDLNALLKRRLSRPSAS